MTEIFKATIPYPPSANRNWRSIPTGSNRPRVLLSKKSRDYRPLVALSIKRPAKPMMGDLCVSMLNHPPDRRRRDFDNLLKAPFDALKIAGVYEDDSQITEFHYKKMGVVKGGQLVLEIKNI